MFGFGWGLSLVVIVWVIVKEVFDMVVGRLHNLVSAFEESLQQ